MSGDSVTTEGTPAGRTEYFYSVSQRALEGKSLFLLPLTYSEDTSISLSQVVPLTYVFPRHFNVYYVFCLTQLPCMLLLTFYL